MPFFSFYPYAFAPALLKRDENRPHANLASMVLPRTRRPEFFFSQPPGTLTPQPDLFFSATREEK
jgi:hypothetical protein